MHVKKTLFGLLAHRLFGARLVPYPVQGSGHTLLWASGPVPRGIAHGHFGATVVYPPGDYPQVHAFTKRVRSKGVHLALERGR